MIFFQQIYFKIFHLRLSSVLIVHALLTGETMGSTIINFVIDIKKSRGFIGSLLRLFSSVISGNNMKISQLYLGNFIFFATSLESGKKHNFTFYHLICYLFYFC